MQSWKKILTFILVSLGIGTGGVLGGLNYRENIPLKYLYTDSVTSTPGAGIAVQEYRMLACEVITNSTTGTLKFVGSLSDAQPDWSLPQSSTNTWDYVQVIDLEDGSSVDGDTGLVLTGSSDVTQYEVNVNLLKWFNVDFTSYSSGTTTVACKPSNNQ